MKPEKSVENPERKSGLSDPAHWPADRVEKRPIAGLVPYGRNARPQILGWGTDRRAGELEALRELAFDLSLSGFGGDELRKLLRSGGNTDPDEVPTVEVSVAVQTPRA